MIDLPSSLLTFSGFITLLIGLACGRPLVVAINRKLGEDKIRGWRVAHSSLIMGAVMALVIALVLPLLALAPAWRLMVALLLSASLLTFSYALVVGPWKGFRGLRREGGTLGRSIYYGNLWGAYLSFAGVGLLVYGAAMTFVSKLIG